MILELCIALLIGVVAGTITGLAPGIHINLVSAIILGSLAYLSQIPVLALAIFIVSMSITHTFIDFIPSIYLGAPDDESFLSILPGHKLLLKGAAHEAFILTLYGSIFAVPTIFIITPAFILGLPHLFNAIKTFIPFILIFLSLFIILRDDRPFSSLLVFALAGSLGFLTFHLPVKEPLLPLLSGLFGLSNLFFSLKSKTKLPPQEIKPLKEIFLTRKEFAKSALASIIFAPLCSFLPGIGSGHAATLGSEFIEQDNRGFLFMLGAINTIIMGLSYVTVYAIQKARTGTAASVQQLLGEISKTDLKIILIAILFAGIISFFLAISLSKFFSRNINKLNYTYLTLAVMVMIITINLIFSNWLGLLVLAAGTSLGFFTISSNSRRINLMACLILPSIAYYLLF
jgi:putative membrane protein